MFIGDKIKGGLFKKWFLSIFLIILISLFILGNQEEFYRIFKIVDNRKVVGILKEKIKNQKKLIKYEKDLHYFSGEHIKFDFRIKPDFSNFNGKILKNKNEQFFITDKYVKIRTKENNIRIYRFPLKVLPSSILNLYIHTILKKDKELPRKISIFYENTLDLLEVEIKKIDKKRWIEIEYFFDKINIKIKKLYFPKRDAYIIYCPPIYFIDDKIDNDTLAIIFREVIGENNTVSTPEKFTGIFNTNSILYKITSIQYLSIPEDNRQIIVNEVKNGNEITLLLKVSKNNNIRDGENPEKYRDFVLSFTNLDELYEIKRVAYEITKYTKNRRKKIKKIIEWIKEEITRVKEGPFNPVEVFRNKKGDCQGISNLFLLMCSVLNIHGRVVVGIIIFNQNQKYLYSFHQWVELWEGNYWIPYDPTFGLVKIGSNYIKLLNLEKKLDLLKLINALNLKVEIIVNR
ncbi:transglutaminase domain-containing protein [Candidatus Aminicenantes bacterium AC-708-M15]|nr:transglutaminase domain-containing protein [Candidatus Aminicenantes bacterium AC-708-M15]